MMEYQSTSFEKQRKKSTAFGNHGFSAVNFWWKFQNILENVDIDHIFYIREHALCI
jgi:hypothetical protein